MGGMTQDLHVQAGDDVKAQCKSFWNAWAEAHPKDGGLLERSIDFTKHFLAQPMTQTILIILAFILLLVAMSRLSCVQDLLSDACASEDEEDVPAREVRADSDDAEQWRPLTSLVKSLNDSCTPAPEQKQAKPQQPALLVHEATSDEESSADEQHAVDHYHLSWQPPYFHSHRTTSTGHHVPQAHPDALSKRKKAAEAAAHLRAAEAAARLPPLDNANVFPVGKR